MEKNQDNEIVDKCVTKLFSEADQLYKDEELVQVGKSLQQNM